MGKVGYLARSIRNAANAGRYRCVNCGAADSAVVERKAIVTALRRCASCKLMYRTPTDEPQEADDFYNADYKEGYVTSLPTPDQVAAFKRGEWGREEFYPCYIAALKELGLAPGALLFDFGCSWGYGSYQFREAGFRTVSYEISRPRAEFGRQNLGIDTVPSFEAWAEENPGTLDAFFSAHVLEHVPSPSRIIALARRALKPGGLFLAYVPNGSTPSRAAVPYWSSLWGEVHPNFLDDVYVNAAIHDRPRLIGSSRTPISSEDADFLTSASAEARYVNDLTSVEMFVAFRT